MYKYKRVFVIAEAGVNHNGCLDMAKKLIDVAVQSGADAVKFQTFKTELCISKNTEKADYQKKNSPETESQFEMVKNLELSESSHRELLDYCNKKNIMFLSTPFDLFSVDFLDNLGIEIFKIPSGEITNLSYLRHIGKKKKNIILSTGMATLGEVEKAISIVIESGVTRAQITVLHATTEYPCPISDVNLNAMQAMARAFGVKVGYSDHTAGIEVPIAAVALGASIIEKHFTLDKQLPGPDHKASLEPDELKAMVTAIRNIELALGDGIKRPSESEQKNIPVVRKSLVATCDIKKGETFTEQNVTAKRPGTGISPMRWDEVMGQKATRSYKADDLL